MNSFWEKVEYYNSKLIPYSLVLLCGIIIFELFTPVENERFIMFIKVLDGIIITIFVIDLAFLAQKARSFSEFLKRYWLDILAVFPFVFVFEFIGKFYRVITTTERIAVGQAILHEGLEAERGIEAATKMSKMSKAGRLIRIIARGIRLITKSRLFCWKEHHHKKRKTRKRYVLS